jgi:hypothetical protein
MMERILSRDNLLSALKRVEKNKGSHGVDEMPVKFLRAHILKNWQEIRNSIKNGTYERNTNIFRGAYSNFEEVLVRQQAESQKEDITDPVEGEADYLFVIKDNKEVDSVIQKIVHTAQSL